MEYTYSNGMMTLPGKELTILDTLVLDLVSHMRCDYVIVSGYVAILFGRGRNTEDIDILIPDEGIEKFSIFYESVVSDGKYYAINATDAEDAYDLMTMHKSSLRFAEKNTMQPNFEIKFVSTAVDSYSMHNALSVELDGCATKIRISPLELQIAFKLHLGSDKDFEDALHLYVTMERILDMGKLKAFLRELSVSETVVERVLGKI